MISATYCVMTLAGCGLTSAKPDRKPSKTSGATSKNFCGHWTQKPLMFAVLVIIAVLGMLLYQITVAIEKRLLLPYAKVL